MIPAAYFEDDTLSSAARVAMKEPEIHIEVSLGDGPGREPRARLRPVVRVRPHQRGVHDVSDTDLPPQIRQRTVAKAHVLLEALPFMQEHHGKVIVVKYGGAAMERAPLAASFAQDIALLQSAGIMPVIVHGGGPQVTKMSASLGIETTFVDGVRVTDAETLDVATMVLAGKLNTEVVASLVTGGVPAVGLSGRRRRACCSPASRPPRTWGSSARWCT